MKDEGILYVAYGKPARREALASIRTLRKYSSLPVAVISDEPLSDTIHLYAPDEDRGARWAKLNMDRLTPFEYTLYLDADTRIRSDVSAGFRILEDGWDLAITPSVNQIESGQWLWHCGAEESAEVVTAWGFFPLVLQGGVIYFAKNERTAAFFEQWRVEWRTYRDQDQGALLRALREVPIQIWLLGRPWNDREGAVVEHHFGAARRT